LAALGRVVPAARVVAGAVLPIIAGGFANFSDSQPPGGYSNESGHFCLLGQGVIALLRAAIFFAALVVTRVVSLRGDTRLCLDLGQVDAPENELTSRVSF